MITDTQGVALDLTRPIIGIENRTAQEAFDIMADRFRSYLSAAQEGREAVDDLERLREATNRKKVGQPYLVGGTSPRAIIDHAIRALDLSMMRHDMIEDLKDGRVKPALASPTDADAVVGEWRDDPSSDERWCAGLDYGQTQLCNVLGVDPATIDWDAATETLDGDVQSVIGKILTARFGDDWPSALAAAKAGEDGR